MNSLDEGLAEHRAWLLSRIRSKALDANFEARRYVLLIKAGEMYEAYRTRIAFSRKAHSASMYTSRLLWLTGYRAFPSVPIPLPNMDTLTRRFIEDPFPFRTSTIPKQGTYI